MKRILLALATLLLIPAAYAADVKISALPAAAALAGTEPIPAVQAGATVRTTPAQINTYVKTNGTLLVPNGGTGVATITGPIKGNGALAFTAAASSDIIGLWSGSCSSTTLLFGGGTCGLIDLTANVSGILPAANGGTNNGFTQFTGPAASTKSFALPNASATVLTDNALVTVPQGGTGVATLTGIAKGNGTSAFSAAASSDVISLWSGSCSSSTVLLGSGACGASPGLPAGANPTASVGLTAVNGSAATFMRSDAAPALSVAIVPTWTGVHTWSLTEPRLLLNQSGAGADLKLWDIDVAAGVLTMRTRTDADALGKTWLSVTRGSTTAVSNVSIGNATDNPTISLLGNGAVAVGGAVTTAGNIIATSSSITAGQNLQASAGFVNTGGSVAPATGIYRPATNQLGFSSASTLRALFDANGNFLFNSALVSSGTKFTTSGCSVSASAGGATAGTFTLGANSCSVIVTMAGATGSTAPTGWTCTAHDRTAPTILIGGEASSTTTTATIPIPAGAGATDVISFSCVGF